MHEVQEGVKKFVCCLFGTVQSLKISLAILESVV